MNAGTLRPGLHGAVFPNMNTPHLLPQQTQSQPGAQPQVQPNPMSMLPNHTNPTQGMGLQLGGGAQPNGGVNPNYNLQLMQAAQTRRPMQHGHPGGLPGAGQPGLNNIPRTMQFPNSMLRPQQPGLTQVGAHAMHQVPQGMATVPMAALNNMNPAMNNMNHRMRVQPMQQPITGGQAGMQPIQTEMGMMRPGIPNPAVFGQLAGRQAGQGHMSNLQATTPFPQSLPMQQQFVTASMQQQQHQPQPPQLAGSPHPPHNAHPGQLPTTLANQQAVALQQQQQFQRMTPEQQQNMLMNLPQNAQMTPNLQHAGARIAPTVGGFPFGAAGSPSQMGDVQQGMPNGIMGTPGAQGRLITPAQTLEQLSQNQEVSFSMAPPQQVPQRPPSQQRPRSTFQMTQQPQAGTRSSPRHTAAALQAQAQQRPQSQPQVQQGSPSQQPGRQTPQLRQQQIHGAGQQQSQQQQLQQQLQQQQLQQQQQQQQQLQQQQLQHQQHLQHQQQQQQRISGMQGRQGSPAQQGSPAGAKPPTPSISGHGPMSAGRPQQVQRTPTVAHAVPAAPPTPAASAPRPPSALANGPQPPAPPGQEPQQVQHPQQPPPQMQHVNQQPHFLQAKMTHQLPPLGVGQGVMFLLKFSMALAALNDEKQQLSFWDNMVKEYFTPEATLKITLWKDNKRDEAKPFEIETPIIPRFFLVTTQSGVKSISINLDGARERVSAQNRSMIECTQAIWTFKYTNGFVVTLRGPFSCHLVATPSQMSPLPVIKFEHVVFDANFHEKFLGVEAIYGQPTSPRTPRAVGGLGNVETEDDRASEEPRVWYDRASIPAEPVNAFGIPQATMRCLELAESVTQMSDLFLFAHEHDLGPRDSLKRFADQLRADRAQAGESALPLLPDGMPGMNGVGSASLFPGSPASSSTVSSQPSVSQNAPPTATPKLGKALPPGQQQQQQQAQASASTPGPASALTPAAAPTPTASSSTPNMPHLTLKRKATSQGQGAESSAASGGGSEPQASVKRPPRKRGRTTGGG